MDGSRTGAFGGPCATRPQAPRRGSTPIDQRGRCATRPTGGRCAGGPRYAGTPPCLRPSIRPIRSPSVLTGRPTPLRGAWSSSQHIDRVVDPLDVIGHTLAARPDAGITRTSPAARAAEPTHEITRDQPVRVRHRCLLSFE